MRILVVSLSKNKFRKVSSGVVLSGVGLCISLNSLGNVCSAKETVVVKSSLSSLGSKSLDKQTGSNASLGKVLLYFCAAVFFCTAAVMIWRYTRSSNSDINVGRAGNPENIKFNKGSNKDKSVSKFDTEGFINLTVKTFTQAERPVYDLDFENLLEFVEKSFVELGLEIEDLNIKAETLCNLLIPRDKEVFNKYFKGKTEDNLKVGIHFVGNHLRLLIAPCGIYKDTNSLDSLYVGNDIENYIKFLNYFFEVSSKKNGWKDKLRITYNKDAKWGEHITIARVERNSEKTVKSSYLKDLTGGNGLVDEEFAIADQNRNGHFEKVFLFNEKVLRSDENKSFFCKTFEPFKGKVFKISKEELRRIVDRKNLEFLNTSLNNDSGNSSVKIKILEVFENGTLAFELEKIEYMTLKATSDVEKVKELAAHLRDNQIEEENNNNDMSIDINEISF